MTFEEWWYSCCDFHHCDDCDITVDCAVDKAIAQSAWEAAQLQSKDEIDALTKERNKWIKRCDTGVKKAWNAAQPKWTLCKDAMPDKTVNCLCLDKDGYVSIDSYRENIHFMQDFIAWMPLPEAPNVHDD